MAKNVWIKTITIKNPHITTQAQLMCAKQRVGGYIDSNHLDALPVSHHSKGSWGPLSWEVDANVDKQDIINSSFHIKISFYGTTLIDSTFDKDNPKLDADFKISGVGVQVEVGIDFDGERIYLSGVLDFQVYKKKFDITILKF